MFLERDGAGEALVGRRVYVDGIVDVRDIMLMLALLVFEGV